MLEPTGRGDHRPVDVLSQKRLGGLQERAEEERRRVRRREHALGGNGLRARRRDLGRSRRIRPCRQRRGGGRERGRRRLQDLHPVRWRVGVFWVLDDRRGGCRAVFWEIGEPFSFGGFARVGRSVRRYERKRQATHALFTEQVAKAGDGVCAIFYELLLCFIPDILSCVHIIIVDRARKMMSGKSLRETCHFLAVKRDRAGDLPFAILVRDTFRQTLLQNEQKKKRKGHPDRSKKCQK